MFIAAQAMHIAAIIREGQRLNARVGSKSEAIRFDADLRGLFDDVGEADPISKRLARYLSAPDQDKDKRHAYPTCKKGSP